MRLASSLEYATLGRSESARAILQDYMSARCLCDIFGAFKPCLAPSCSDLDRFRVAATIWRWVLSWQGARGVYRMMKFVVSANEEPQQLAQKRKALWPCQMIGRD
jgi:hypothetical protein